MPALTAPPPRNLPRTTASSPPRSSPAEPERDPAQDAAGPAGAELPRLGRGAPPVQLERHPWSQAGAAFIREWSRTKSGKYQPEHLEILGQSGSGKSFLLVQILIAMILVRHSSVIYIATKPADETIMETDWPIVDTWRDVQKHDVCIFWPRTSKTGRARDQYMAAKIQDLLDRLWTPGANTIVVFDEIAKIESLSPDLKATVAMYLREGRSQGIVCVMGKQRGQGVQRDMHSESSWTIVFPLKTTVDREYAAGLLGGKNEWLPVLATLNKARHEFIVQHQASDTEFISWVDAPIDPKIVSRKQSSYTS